ncbi:DUF5131 family protein [Streptomyces scopuliridis]|uniref:DUF5131 family protein n=1 Tax=Streptomyces scopuliridis TaxID=452529 RepID=UPI003F578094
MANTNIEWATSVWNPTTGCDRVSPGCDNCYALTMAKRLKGMGQAKYQTDGDPRTSGPGFGLTMHPDVIREPLRWKKPRRVFVNSMSDLFHTSVTDEFIARVWAVMALTPQHTYQILTKRHARMQSLLNRPTFADMIRTEMTHEFGAYTALARNGSWKLPLRNVHLGVSVEDQKRADLRIPALLDTPAAVRFLSCEPLLGPVDLKLAIRTMGSERGHGLTASYVHAGGCCDNRLHGIDWVIVGGESGRGARPLNESWVSKLVADATNAGTAVFVKQLGSVWARQNGASDSKGGKPADWPEALRVREHPNTP